MIVDGKPYKLTPEMKLFLKYYSKAEKLDEAMQELRKSFTHEERSLINEILTPGKGIDYSNES